MVIQNTGAPVKTWTEYEQNVWKRDAAFIGPRQRPDWNSFYQTGVWPKRSLYEATFIGPRPPTDMRWKPYDKSVVRSGSWFFANFHILPDPNDVLEWIRQNATTPVHFFYNWERKGTRKLKRKEGFIFNPGGDNEANSAFERVVHRVFKWLERGQAFTAMFTFLHEEATANRFKTHFPWHYKE